MEERERIRGDSRREGKRGEGGRAVRAPSGSSGSRVDEGFVNNRAAIRRPGETRTHVDSGRGALPLVPFFVEPPLRHRPRLFLYGLPTPAAPSPSSLIFLLLAPVPPPHPSHHHHLLLLHLLPRLPGRLFSTSTTATRSRKEYPGRVRSPWNRGRLPSHDNWWVSVSWFGREVSPGPPTRRSQTTTTTGRRGDLWRYTQRPTVFWCAYLFGLPANSATKRSFSRRRAPKRSRPVSPEDTRATIRYFHEPPTY